MARPKKATTSVMLQLVESYFESTGNPDKLKCSHLEEYAASTGLDLKAYDFRRDAAVRQRMDELRDLYLLHSESGAIAYKNLDVDALLGRCRTKTMLRNSLFELDETWRRIYDRAVELFKKNEALKATTEQSAKEFERLLSDNAVLSEQVKRLNKSNKEAVQENRYLKKMLKMHLYPAIANEILLRENVLERVDTEVSQSAMEKMVDSTVPSPFSSIAATDMEMFSREDALLNRMRNQIQKG